MSLGLALGCVYGVGLSNLFAIWRLSWLTEAMNKRTFWYYLGHVHVMARSSGMVGIYLAAVIFCVTEIFPQRRFGSGTQCLSQILCVS